MSDKDELLSPVLKWGGGKRQLLDEILPKIPEYTRYYEPFIGGAAVLFGLKPENAVINDSNNELINVYLVIRDHPEELITQLKKHKENNSVDYYYKIREWDRDEREYGKRTDIERAARTLYLNRTCFNGLYRVNLNGYFNTPCGKYKNPEIVFPDRIRAIHNYLLNNNVDIRCGDYKDALRYIRSGAFVYFDPPYMPPENGNETFTKYTVDGFGEEKQIELKVLCDKLHNMDVKFMLSNSYCAFIRDLYKDYNVNRISARRSISADGRKRTMIDEVLVTNYDF